MTYLTDETMDDIAQWQHDTAWETPEANDPEIVSEVFDCVHDDTCTITEYDTGSKLPVIVTFKVWQCSLCGCSGEVGKEY